MKVLLNANMQYNFNSNHVNNSAQLSIPAVYVIDFTKCIKVVYYTVDSRWNNALYICLCFYHSFYCGKYVPMSDHRLQRRFPIANWIKLTNDWGGGVQIYKMSITL